MCRVTAPENDTVCTVFHFTEGAGWKPDILHCDKSGSMTNCGSVIDTGLHNFSDFIPDALGFAVCGTPSVHQGFLRFDQNLRGIIRSLFVGRVFPGSIGLLEPGTCYAVLCLGVQEFFRPNSTGVKYFRDLPAVIGDFHFKVVAESAAERAYDIGNHFRHQISPLQAFWTSSTPRRIGWSIATSTSTGTPLNVGIPVE